jgi:EmrB/QacA subfamily drug resistance transporter
MVQNPVKAMLGISLVIVLIALDQTVVGTALPSIVADLKGYELYPWIGAIYLLTNAIFIPIIGRLGDIHGRKPFMLGAIIIFTLSSVLCGSSKTMLQLVIFRGLQGIGGGMLTGSAFASVPDLFPNLKDRIRWQVMISSAFGIASALGPALGGLMTVHLGWRSIFYINLPVGVLALMMVWRYLPLIVHHQERKAGLDWAGVALLVMALFALLFISELGANIGLLSYSFWALLTCALILIYGFYRHQISSQGPILPAHLLSHATVRLLAIMSLLTGMMLFLLVFYLPLLFQAGFSLTPKASGALVTPLLVGITFGSILNGRIIMRVKNSQFIYPAGVAILMIGLLMLTQSTITTEHLFLIVACSFCGLGLGFQIPNLVLQMQFAVARQDLGAGSALVQTLRTVGSMFGASIGALIVNLTFNHSVKHYLDHLKITDNRVAQLFETPQILVRQIDQLKLSQIGHEIHTPTDQLMEQARLFLVDGIHIALWVNVAIASIAIFLSLKLPNLSAHQSEKK